MSRHTSRNGGHPKSLLRRATAWLAAVALAILGPAAHARANEPPIRSIAFGSCLKQDRPAPILETVAALKPDLFIFLGDNVYGDTENMAELMARYEQLGAQPGFRKLRDACRILAVWDDHDYGANDAGAEFELKDESKRVMLDFFGEPAGSPRRARPGNYDAVVLGPEGRRVQVILLDLRSFRSPLLKGDPDPAGAGTPGPYIRNEDLMATMLGPDQWLWLEEQLAQPAELRIIASSIQFAATDHRFEKWGNLPFERERVLKAIRDAKAEGVVFISGDRHHAELSRIGEGMSGYPTYDLTSSALNQTGEWVNEINTCRAGCVYREPNFGMIGIDWDQPDPQITLQIRRGDGDVVIQQQFPLGLLRFGPQRKS